MQPACRASTYLCRAEFGQSYTCGYTPRGCGWVRRVGSNMRPDAHPAGILPTSKSALAHLRHGDVLNKKSHWHCIGNQSKHSMACTDRVQIQCSLPPYIRATKATMYLLSLAKLLLLSALCHDVHHPASLVPACAAPPLSVTQR